MKPDLLQTVKDLKAVADFLKIKVRFRFDAPGGESDPANSTIYVGIVSFNPDTLISTFFHEVAHVYCYQAGKFPIYHAPKHTKKEKIAVRRTALRAERYVDQKGAELCKLFFPNVRYSRSYRSKEHTAKLRKYWADY